MIDARTTIDGKPSLVAPDTLLAYRETAYHVGRDRDFTLRVDVHSPELLERHARHGVSCSAFVTACNPLGRRHAQNALLWCGADATARLVLLR